MTVIKVSEKLVKGLNPQQEIAVTTVNGAIQVNAGAGSGKTRVLVNRIAHMVNDCKINPKTILATTFTKKATGEMKERLEKLIPAKSLNDITLGSSHSIGYRILANELPVIGHPLAQAFKNPREGVLQNMGLKIFLDDVKKSISKDYSIDSDIRKMIEEIGFKKLTAVIGVCKNNGMNPYDYEQHIYSQNITSPRTLAYVEFYKRYELLKEQAKKIDFDDMLFLTAKLFREHKDILSKYQKQYDYVLVDEGQDNNQLQYEIFESIASPQNNIFLVGDDDQSMYSFRGAKPEEFISFKQRYPHAKIIKLEDNYRCDSKILDRANMLIANNNERLQKTLKANKFSDNQTVFYNVYQDEFEEGKEVVNEIQVITENENIAYKDIVVLYRTNAQSVALEDELITNGIPYVIHGGLSFYERSEIKDIVAYLTLANDINRNEAFERAYKTPLRGLGKAFLEEVKAIRGKSYFQNMNELHLTKRNEVDGVAGFNKIITTLQAMKINNKSITEMIDYLLDNGYKAHLLNDIDGEDGAGDENNPKLENVNTLKHLVSNYESVEQFLEYFEKMAGKRKRSEVDGVQLMTIHRSKGLEFNTVFVVGMNEGLLPHYRAVEAYEEGNMTAIEEERRLGYVAVTRAERAVYISSLQSYNGKQTMASRFVNEMDLFIEENEEIEETE